MAGCWSYDSFGNRTAKSYQPAACPAPTIPPTLAPTATYNGNNQVTWTSVNAAGTSFPYDTAGNVLNDGQNQYLYDGDGQICAVASTPMPGMTVMTGYLYDASGTRVAKGSISKWSCDPTVSGFQTTNDYILGLGGEQVTEMGVGGTTSSGETGGLVWQHTNIWAGGKLLGTYDGGSTTETVSGNPTVVTTYGLHFYFNDPLGTRRAQTDYAGVLEQTCSSLPFGDRLSCTGSTITPTEHHFTGKERDSESGNDYFEARYYASSMGRFMSPDWSAKSDPVPYAVFADPQSLNLYAYVRNNPMSRVDADGHWDCSGANAKGIACQAMAAIHAANGLVQNSLGKLVDAAVTAIKGPLPKSPTGNQKAPSTPIWKYKQSTGGTTLNIDSITIQTVKPGYSGHGAGVNDPESESVGTRDDAANAGPIPRGSWTISAPYSGSAGNPMFDLSPNAGTEMFGRDGIEWHANNDSKPPLSSSEGCIVSPLSTRQAVAGSGITDLEVVQ